MGSFEGRCIVGAVACDCYHLVLALQGFDESPFVHRASTGYYLYAHYHSIELRIGERSKLRSANYIFIRILVCPQPNLTTYFLSRFGCVAGDYLHAYSCLQTLLYRLRYFLTHGVSDCCYTKEAEL